jgi:hypothetical protein
VSSSAIRNIGILVVLAALVAFAPGAGFTASVVSSLVNGAILTVFVFAIAVMYRRYQHELWALGDQHRALLYGAVGLFILMMAGRTQLTLSPAGTAVFVVGMLGVAVGLWAVVRRHQAYR